ncbi:transcriptional regulator [Mesorhizobium sp. L-8-10]|uniref:dimethylsulfonioproprionate lyase family protein n=1 Tax=Mesorhizobium sp. L-8-10 TaxID=2744523 RepID=UPI0019379122|nr:dimethylsulfonioproprionate lyase family protein [Mesorhizobium sp. L-8-10]BCH32128.1 transcriptional regulator [Mesorhizobium sp. L-8-10]
MMATTIPQTLLQLFREYLGTLPAEPLASYVSEINWDMAARAVEPGTLACLGYLDRVAEIARPEALRLVRFLAEHRQALLWQQTYTAADFGQHFVDRYGWLELFGTRGHFANENVAAGFLILGPEVVYPDHHHVAEEIYVPLTGGTEWRKETGDYLPRGAGEVIHHPSNVNHAMRTRAEPLLALYLWRAGPLAQKPVVSN